MMHRAMVHPYTGELVVCAQHDGTQHDQEHAVASTNWEQCATCLHHFETCRHCRVVIGCCYCGNYHAIECPWPL